MTEPLSPLDGRARARLLDMAEKIRKGKVIVRRLEHHTDTHDYGRLYVEVWAEPVHKPRGRKKKP
jgi:hypothetical protein